MIFLGKNTLEQKVANVGSAKAHNTEKRTGLLKIHFVSSETELQTPDLSRGIRPVFTDARIQQTAKGRNKILFIA